MNPGWFRIVPVTGDSTEIFVKKNVYVLLVDGIKNTKTQLARPRCSFLAVSVKQSQTGSSQAEFSLSGSQVPAEVSVWAAPWSPLWLVGIHQVSQWRTWDDSQEQMKVPILGWNGTFLQLPCWVSGCGWLYRQICQSLSVQGDSRAARSCPKFLCGGAAESFAEQRLPSKCSLTAGSGRRGGGDLGTSWLNSNTF